MGEERWIVFEVIIFCRRHKEKKEEVAQPEADPERDQRTVFAYQISLKADERDVYDFFSRAGKVRDVRLIMDRNARRSKGVGYIEFFDAMSVPMGIALSGQPLLGQPVMVKPSEAEKNLVQSTTATAGATGGGIGPYSGGARRLYVGNLHINMKEDQLRQVEIIVPFSGQTAYSCARVIIVARKTVDIYSLPKMVFEPFGAVELVQLPTDESGNCKGFGFVQFARLEDARAAQSLDQLEIGGRAIKVSAVTDQPGMQDFGTNAGDFDDDEGGGLVSIDIRNTISFCLSLSYTHSAEALNARSRALLMQKLDRSGSTASAAGSLGNPVVNSPGFALPTGPILVATPTVPPLAGLPGGGLSVPPITVPSVDILGVPSECLLLKNMFDPKLETEPDFDLDIEEDVRDECSKFGALKHIYVDKNTAGFVYLHFEKTQSAIGAQRSLHGRWFAGKMITATFMVLFLCSFYLYAFNQSIFVFLSSIRQIYQQKLILLTFLQVPQNYEAKFPDSR
ncbi:hypothetical protein C3L33_20707, partial [Rhododendron williamsianum]